eukprot:COSAG04_NODE_34413_length_110_cov_46.909091_1_plen_20_part_10
MNSKPTKREDEPTQVMMMPL